MSERDPLDYIQIGPDKVERLETELELVNAQAAAMLEALRFAREALHNPDSERAHFDVAWTAIERASASDAGAALLDELRQLRQEKMTVAWEGLHLRYDDLMTHDRQTAERVLEEAAKVADDATDPDRGPDWNGAALHIAGGIRVLKSDIP